MSIFAKIKAIPRGVKASIAFFIASIVTKGIAYITTPLYTRLLSAEEYGQVTIYYTWMHLFGIIAMFCLSYGVFNNGMVDYPDQRDEYSFSMLVLSNAITLCFSGILLCVYPLIREAVGLDIPFLLLMLIVFLFQPAYSFWSSRQRYEFRYKWTVVWSIASAFLSPLVAILLIVFTDNDSLYARIFGAEITLILIYIGFYIYLAWKAKGKINTAFWKIALKFNLPLIPHYLSTYLLSSSDKLMISSIVGDEATAYYSVAYSVAAIVTVFWTAVNSSLIPHTYTNCKNKNFKAISDVTTPILTAFALVCGLVILMAPEVVSIMATDDYFAAVYVIPPVVGGVFFQVHYYLYANVVFYFKSPKYVMFASISAAALNILLNYIFINRFGYLAAGYTTLVSYLLQAALDYFAMRKVVDVSIYNMRYIGMLSLIIIVISLISNIVYNHTLIRYIIIFIIMLIVAVLRKKIVSVIINLKERTK